MAHLTGEGGETQSPTAQFMALIDRLAYSVREYTEGLAQEGAYTLDDPALLIPINRVEVSALDVPNPDADGRSNYSISLMVDGHQDPLYVLEYLIDTNQYLEGIGESSFNHLVEIGSGEAAATRLVTYIEAAEQDSRLWQTP